MSDPNFQRLVEKVEALKERITDDWVALGEAASILRQITLDRDPREKEPAPVSIETRTAAASWLAAHDPEIKSAENIFLGVAVLPWCGSAESCNEAKAVDG